MKVTLDAEERKVRGGAPAMALLSEEQRQAAAEGRLFVADARGNRVGLQGALTSGGSYFAVRSDARPPSVNACLEVLGRAGAWDFPADLSKFLVRRAIAKLGEAGGAASAEATAAFAVATAARQDAAALWAYIAGEAAAVFVFEAGRARVRELAPAVKTVVAATRDVLTFRTGQTTFDYFDGVRVVEVGTTNKVKPADYEAKFAEVDAVAACRAGDFAVVGFVEEADPSALAQVAAAAGLKFVGVFADGTLFDERGVPRRREGDVVIWPTPAELRAYDVAFVAEPPAGFTGDRALYEDAAKALWRYLGKAS